MVESFRKSGKQIMDYYRTLQNWEHIYSIACWGMVIFWTGWMSQLLTQSLGNQLWAIFVPLRRAKIEGYRDVILETDNAEAFKIKRNFNTVSTMIWARSRL